MLSAEEAEDCDGTGENTLFAAMSARSETLAGKLAAELRGWLQQLVNDPSSRVDGAQYAAEQAHYRIQDLLSAVARDTARTRETTHGMKLSIPNDIEDAAPPSRWMPFRGRNGKLAAILTEYGNTQIHAIVLAVVHKQLRTIEAQVGVTIDQAQRLSHDLTRLSRKFELPKDSQATNSANTAFDASVAWYVQGVREKLLSKRTEIIQHLEGVIEETLAQDGYTLQRFLDSRVELADILLLPMREHARDVVSRAVAAIHCELIGGDGDPGSDDEGSFQLPQLIHNLIRAEWPVGPRGQESVSVVIPQSADAARLRNQLLERGDQGSVVNLITNGITLLRQIENVSPHEYLRALTPKAEAYKDLASRLHSRDDVKWSPLAPPEDPANPRGQHMLAEGVKVDQTAVMQP
jgi:hypothetical protein